MVSTSKIDIINLGLGHLKQRPVQAIDPPIQTAAKIAVKYYDDAILMALRIMRPWWAKRQASLSKSAVTPLYGPANVFPMPADFVALLTIGSCEVSQYTEDYDLLEDGLHINEPGPLPIGYIFAQFDVTKYDSIFRMCASYSLAALAAYELTGNSNLRQMYSDLAESLTQTQQSLNGQERPVKRFQQSKILAARRRSTSSFGR